MKEKESSHHEFMKWILCLNNLVAFNDEMSSFITPTVLLSCDHLETSMLIASSYIESAGIQTQRSRTGSIHMQKTVGNRI